MEAIEVLRTPWSNCVIKSYFIFVSLEYSSEYATQREQFQQKLSTFGQIQVMQPK